MSDAVAFILVPKFLYKKLSSSLLGKNQSPFEVCAVEYSAQAFAAQFEEETTSPRCLPLIILYVFIFPNPIPVSVLQ